MKKAAQLRRNLNVALATACAVVVGGTLAAGAATLHVATTGSDTEGDGTQAKPYATIGNALDQCSDGDEIRIQEGLYREAVANTKEPTQSEVTFEPAQLVVDGPRRYRLLKTSPARNAGKYSHAASCPVSLETDLAGNKRSARHWDLGCYRYDLPGMMLLVR